MNYDKDFTKYLILLSMFLAILIITVWFLNEKLNPDVRGNVIIKTVQKSEQPFEEIINDVYTQNTYNDTFKCGEFSKELVRRLKENGYEAEYIKGELCVEKPCGCHAWVKLSIYVESTSGEILTPDYYKENYIPNNCKKEWF